MTDTNTVRAEATTEAEQPKATTEGKTSVFQGASADKQDAPTDKSIFSELVGEGRKFRDAEALAKAKLEADTFIERLKRENEELRQLLDKAVSRDEIMEILQQRADDSASDKAGTTPPASDRPALDVDKLREIIRTENEALSAQERAKANLAKVEETLVAKFGDDEKAAEFLATKAKELGVSLKRFEEIAAESPQAFVRLVGLDAPASPRSHQIKGTVSTEGTLGEGNERDWTYYRKLRKENPKVYYSATIQRQMLIDRERLGDRFFGG